MLAFLFKKEYQDVLDVCDTQIEAPPTNILDLFLREQVIGSKRLTKKQKDYFGGLEAEVKEIVEIKEKLETNK